MNPVFDLDPQLSIQSLDRLDGVEADVLLPGHGQPWHGSTAEAVAMARASSMP
jgi:glyoxylase-like metal-dependent hydrolase (beta-lactamase superfamily II)